MPAVVGNLFNYPVPVAAVAHSMLPNDCVIPTHAAAQANYLTLEAAPGFSVESRLQSALRRRAVAGRLRQLRAPNPDAVDFSSNDYLGLARSTAFRHAVREQVEATEEGTTGATGSRLLSGHSAALDKLEQTAARFHYAESALLLNSGYDANLSLLSCLPGPADAIVYDRLVHASVHDGMRMSRAAGNLFSFAHNDARSMSNVVSDALTKCAGSVFVCIETVYSMDGDVAPLGLMLKCLERLRVKASCRDIQLIADEAHAGGLYGPNGEGLAVALGVHAHSCLFARIITFSKAYGAHGAVVLSSENLKQYLVNYARPFIYSTALPPHSVAMIRAVYAFASSPSAHQARSSLWSRRDYFRAAAAARLAPGALLPFGNDSPIQSVLLPGNLACVDAANMLRASGYNVYPIRSPTVPRGTERIRIIIHANNTPAQIEGLVETMANVLPGTKHQTAHL